MINTVIQGDCLEVMKGIPDKSEETLKFISGLLTSGALDINSKATDPLYSKAISRYVSRDEILDEREKLTDYICNIVIKNKII